MWEVAFEGDGRRMVSCSDDATLKIWACGKEGGEWGGAGPPLLAVCLCS